MNPLSPLSDTKIAARYGARNVEQKLENKKALQKELGWPMEAKIPLLCLPMGMSPSLGGDLFKEVLSGLLSLPMEIIILGKGSSEYGEIFTKLTKERGHRLAIVPHDEDSIHKMYAASDMALFLADAAGTEELKNCLKYGVVPIAPEGTPLEDYNPVQETGDSFLFTKPTVWNCFAAIVRSMETYKFPFDWRTIERHGMEKAEK